MKNTEIFVATLLGSSALLPPCYGQGNPGFIFNQVPTPAQWNSYFSAKVDVINGVMTNGTIGSSTLNSIMKLGAPIEFEPINPTQYQSGTIAYPPNIDINTASISGTIGNGGAVRAPSSTFVRLIYTADTLVLNNGSVPHLLTVQDNIEAGAQGGRSLAQFVLNQQGSVTADGIHNPFFGVLGQYLTFNYPSSGTSLTSTGGQVTVANPDCAFLPGAMWYSSVSCNGETDMGIAPASQLLTMSGPVTAGDTLTLNFSSTILGLNETVQYVSFASDVTQLQINGLASAARRDPVLYTAGVGIGAYGSTSSTPDQLNLGWPAWATDMVITAATTGGETMTLGTPVAGATMGDKFYQSFVSLRSDGSSGNRIPNDGLFLVAKQSSKGAWTTGGMHALFVMGGVGGIAPDSDTGPEVSQWPMDPTADWFIAVPPTLYGNGVDAPIGNIVSHSIFKLTNAVFTSPFLLAGYQLWGDGTQSTGSVSLGRISGSTVEAGVSLAATGWEGVLTLNNGGGAPNTGVLNRRYMVGDIATCGTINGAGVTVDAGWGDHAQVTQVSPLGGAAQFVMVNDGTHYDYPSTGASLAPPTTCYEIGGSGTGWINNVTWTAGNEINIGAAGQTVALLGTVLMSGTIDNTLYFSPGGNLSVLPSATNTSGAYLNLYAGASGAGTNLNGGNVVLASGTSTGTGTSGVVIYTTGPGVSGTTDNAPAQIALFGGNQIDLGGSGDTVSLLGTITMPGTIASAVNFVPGGGTISILQSATNTTGHDIDILAGTTGGGTNQNGGVVALIPGVSTGTGAGAVAIYATGPGSSGTSANAPQLVAEFTGIEEELSTHLSYVGPGTPTAFSCGTSPTITGSDGNYKVVTSGASITTCTITHAQVWLTDAPLCQMTPETIAVGSWAITSTTFTDVLTWGTEVSNAAFHVQCTGIY